MDLNELAKPFDDRDIEWRVQRAGKGKNGIWAIVVPYVDNRAIQDRLDAVCGPENWCNHYEPGPNGGVLCGISINVDGEWVTKWDGADNTDVEPVKGGLSGSMKRAAVHWGLGRELYELPTAFAKIHDSGKRRNKVKIDGNDEWIRWDPPTLDELRKGQPASQPTPSKPASTEPTNDRSDTGPSPLDVVNEAISWADALGVERETFANLTKERYGVDSAKELTLDQAQDLEAIVRDATSPDEFQETMKEKS